MTEASALNQHDTIRRFIQGTIAEGAPVVPISAQLKYNVDAVCEYLVKKIPVPVRDFTSPPQVSARHTCWLSSSRLKKRLLRVAA